MDLCHEKYTRDQIGEGTYQNTFGKAPQLHSVENE